MRITRTLFRLKSARTATFPARQSYRVLVNRMPTIRRSATVHRDHFYFRRRGNVSCARVNRDEQIRTPKNFRQIR